MLYKTNNECFIRAMMSDYFIRWKIARFPSNSAPPRWMEAVQSFNSWNNLPHCTHNHSLFVYWIYFWLHYVMFLLNSNTLEAVLHLSLPFDYLRRYLTYARILLSDVTLYDRMHFPDINGWPLRDPNSQPLDCETIGIYWTWRLY